MTAPHLAAPGPDYWGWRCLKCSERVADRQVHPGLVRLFLRRLRGRS